MISDQQRLNAYTALSSGLGGLLQIVNKTDFPGLSEIRQRIRPLQANFMIMRPERSKEGFLGYTSIWHSSPSTGSSGDLKIYMCFPEDRDIHNDLGVLIDQHTEAQGYYIPLLNMIAINATSGETLAYKAHCLLHELGHCAIAVSQGRAMTATMLSRDQMIAEEVEMRTFDYQFLLALGGLDYRRQAQELDHKLTLYHTRRQKRPPLLEGKGAALDHCWGLVESPTLRKKRDAIFTLFCDLMAIDQFPGMELDEAWKRKCALIATNWCNLD